MPPWSPVRLDGIANGMKYSETKRRKARKICCAPTKCFYRDAFHSVYVVIDTFICAATIARTTSGNGLINGEIMFVTEKRLRSANRRGRMPTRVGLLELVHKKNREIYLSRQHVAEESYRARFVKRDILTRRFQAFNVTGNSLRDTR